MSKKPITTAQAAQLLGCSQRTVLRMIDRQILHGWKITPGLKSVYMVSEDDVKKVLAAREKIPGRTKRA